VKRAPRDALQDTLPYALAAYGTARSQEIEVLDWRHVDLCLGAAELAGDEEGRKPGGSWRVVPLVAPLQDLLGKEWLAQGRPRKGKVCPPLRIRTSGRRSMRGVQRRVRPHWQAHGLEPIGLRDARHTAATWLDHAGVSPKVCSQIMGTRRPNISLVPSASPCSATPMSFRGSWSTPGSASTDSSPRGAQIFAALPFPLAFPPSEIPSDNGFAEPNLPLRHRSPKRRFQVRVLAAPSSMLVAVPADDCGERRSATGSLVLLPGAAGRGVVRESGGITRRRRADPEAVGEGEEGDGEGA
jgi:hypothetical protein